MWLNVWLRNYVEIHNKTTGKFPDTADKNISVHALAFHRAQLPLYSDVLQLRHRGDTQIRRHQGRLADNKKSGIVQPLGRLRIRPGAVIVKVKSEELRVES